MSEYGLTPKGPNIKRLDEIIESLHKNLSERWGVNTRQNPESLINHVLTNVADQIAELWEFGESVYYSQYPATAEGINLDNAAQYGGSTREPAAKSYYPIHCTGKDGTVLAAGTIIASTTNPTTQLSLAESRTISRSAFNKAAIKVASLQTGNPYIVIINNKDYRHTAGTLSALEILNGLAEEMGNDFTVSVDTENELLNIEADAGTTNDLTLSENLTTETVTSIITFGTVETGNILLPDGVITNIVKADAGLQSVVNVSGYIAGRDEESDAEFRMSYADKIFNRSKTMLDTIRSAILNNVQGVASVATYENDSDITDEYGRPPHSIEIVVDGGDNYEIAQQIFANKAAGISTHGNEEVTIVGSYDENFTIKFSRPEIVYVWFHLKLERNSSQSIPDNYEELLRSVVTKNMENLDAGTDVVPMRFMTELYDAFSGINYIDITLTATSNKEKPSVYTARSQAITARQRAFTSEDMITVDFYE